MPDPGYGPNGERLDPTGLISWQSNAPPVPVVEGDDQWVIYAIGMTYLPAISLTDDESWKSVYPGG